MRPFTVLTFVLLSVFSIRTSAQTSVGAFGTLGVAALHGLGITGEKHFKALGPGGGFTIRHRFPSGVFLASEPAYRSIRTATSLTFTTESGQIIREFLTIAYNRTVFLPIQAGYYLLRQGAFQPWLGAGLELNLISTGVTDGSGASMEDRKVEYLFLSNQLGFDLHVGRTIISLMANLSPYYFVSQYRNVDSISGRPRSNKRVFKGYSQFGIRANKLRLGVKIPVGRESGWVLEPGAEAIAWPGNVDKVYLGYLAMRFGVVKTL